jgi:hypothetical protein
MSGFMPEDIRERFGALLSPELQPETEEVLAARGVPPVLAGPEDIQKARTQRQAEEIAMAGAKKREQLTTEWEMEPGRPISAADRAKYGVGTKFRSYTDLANAGYRFPSETDRKDYSDLSDAIGMIDDLQDLITNVFSSGDDYASRLAHGVAIRASMASGGELGLAAKEYERQLGILGRKMLSLVERGGRFTNQDMEQILKTIPQINWLAPDGSKLAGRLFERSRMIAARKLELYENVLVKPVGQPTTEPPTGGEATPQKGDLFQQPDGTFKELQ